MLWQLQGTNLAWLPLIFGKQCSASQNAKGRLRSKSGAASTAIQTQLQDVTLQGSRGCMTASLQRRTPGKRLIT
eukprot:6114615-Amphidinium_carterae.1